MPRYEDLKLSRKYFVVWLMLGLEKQDLISLI